MLLVCIAWMVHGRCVGQADCNLKKSGDSVKVYLCHTDTSRLKYIKAEFWLNGKMSELVSHIMDVERYVDWQYNTIDVRVIGKKGLREVTYYAEIEAPWPISNRDMVGHIIVSQDPVSKQMTIQSNGRPQAVPEVNEKVRVPYSKSQWLVDYVKPGLLKVDYFIQIDPGGSVPVWMVNMVAAEAPFVTFKNLRKRMGVVKQSDEVDVSFVVDE